MSATTILVTGSKAGIGKGLLSTYAARPNTIAIAAIRDGPATKAAAGLESLPVGKGSKIIVAKYDAASRTSAADLVSTLKSTHNITHLDVVVANAGILNEVAKAKDASYDQLSAHINVNTFGPIVLYQATYDLLRAAQSPKFFIISSSLGSVGFMENMPLPVLSYGMSKSAVNYFAKKANMEDDKVTVAVFQPGWVQTNMGEGFAKQIGMQATDVPVTQEKSVGGLIRLFDEATKEKTGGAFPDAINEGEVVPW